jgi:hypothetical protein
MPTAEMNEMRELLKKVPLICVTTTSTADVAALELRSQHDEEIQVWSQEKAALQLKVVNLSETNK